MPSRAPAPPAPPVVRNLTTMITAVRWGTTSVGLLYATATDFESMVTVVLGLVLLAYAIVRTFKPLDMEPFDQQTASVGQKVAALCEIALGVGIVASTGAWNSPYALILFTPLVAAGFTRGIRFSLAMAALIVVAIQLAALLTSQTTTPESTATLVAELLLIACIASYSRHLLSRATTTRSDELKTLTETNRLLISLNRLSDQLSASFDLQETVQTAMKEVGAAAGTEVVALLLSDRTNDTWNIAYVEGVRLAEALETNELPVKLQQHLDSSETAHPVRLEQGEGFMRSAQTAIYIPLYVGGVRIGVIALESPREMNFEASHLTALRDLADRAGLTVENARWFERLRARSAAEERYRIARDLHDRVGQGVAYVAFELERLSGASGDISEDLGRLRVDSKRIVGELRETLYDLRTEVSTEHSLQQTVKAFAQRVSARAGIDIDVQVDETIYLPISQQKELWRIVQESIVNAERHADADKILVRVVSKPKGTSVLIEDDGSGISDSDLSRSRGPNHTSYGITGMRERAALLGARLTVSQRHPNGTRVALELGKIEMANQNEEQTAGDLDG